MENLVNALNCNESVFNYIYDELYKRAASENEAMYQTALLKAKTKTARNKVSGRYCGRWQELLSAYCQGKIPNIYCLEAISCDFISESLYQYIN